MNQLCIDKLYAQALYRYSERVLVCGSRSVHRGHLHLVYNELVLMPKNTVIIHGACRGADLVADEVARELGLTIEAYPAEWDRLGRAAGPLRNTKMLESGVGLVLSFWDGVSGGTADTMKKARKMGIPVRVVETGA
jgi:hypothetical protein